MAKERTITLPSTTTTVSKNKIREAAKSVVRESSYARSVGRDPRPCKDDADTPKRRKTR